ncbi:hypothetical protein [Sphingobium sp.]|uniref:hypothetical protein n=1 Tax=Sphingobium sp. TaxID=1912891 RepID=UPI002ECFC9C3
MSVCAIARPKSLAELLPFATIAGPSDVTILFVHSPEEVEASIDTLLARHRPDDRLWFAYPKKTGRIPGTLSRDHGWEALATRDFLPVTQIAIDKDWSALRFRPRSEIARLTRKTDLPGRAQT